MTETVLEIVDLTEIVGDMGIPCDHYDNEWHLSGDAQWVLHLSVCKCGHTGQRLVCDGCKEFLLNTDEDCLECQCGEIWYPPRRAYARVEPLDRKGSRR